MMLSSCNSALDQDLEEVGDPTPVRISVAVPSDVMTRVTEDEFNIPGKGKSIKTIQYAIYDKKGHLLEKSDMTTKLNPQKKEDLDIISAYKDDHGLYSINTTLMKNHDYIIYVWASSDVVEYELDGSGNYQLDSKDRPIVKESTRFTSPYTFSAENKTVSIDWAKVDANVSDGNEEKNDAFFGKKEFHVANAPGDDGFKVDMILYRPLAQLNIMINDQTKAKALEAGTKLSSIDLELKKAPGTYSLFNIDNYIMGTPKADPASERTLKLHKNFTNGWDDLIHAGDGDVAKYYYLGTFYLPTGVDADTSYLGGFGSIKETTDLKIRINYDDGTFVEIDKTGVPIQRDWRTNIYGALETTDVTVDCRIDFNFIGFNQDGPGAGNGNYGPDDGDHSGDDNSNNETID